MRIKGNFESRRIWIDRTELLPDLSLKFFVHSPDGFNWGYSGSGPTQLALALCIATAQNYDINVQDAISFYQHVKFDFVARWPQCDFEGDFDIEGYIKSKIKYKDEDHARTNHILK